MHCQDFVHCGNRLLLH